MTDTTPKQVTCAACYRALPLAEAVTLPAATIKRNGRGVEVGTLYFHRNCKPVIKEAKR